MHVLQKETAPRYTRPEGITSYLLASPRTSTAEHLTTTLVEIPPGGQQRLHRHAPEQVYFILEGQGLMTVGSETQQVRKNDCVFIPSGQAHGLKNDGQTMLRYFSAAAPAFEREALLRFWPLKSEAETLLTDEDEQEVLRFLDNLCCRAPVRVFLDGLAQKAERQLQDNPTAVMAWEPVPLDLYGTPLPGSIQSSWVFILRADVATGAERHPNSRQRMMSYSGSGDLQTRTNEPWLSNPLGSDPALPLEKRWISIPENVWHQAVTPAANWVVVSFHTVPAEELIEERPDPDDPGSTSRRKYLSQMVPGVSIRECGLSDIEAVLQLWRQADATPSVTDSADELRRALTESSAKLLVAQVRDQIIGSIIGAFDGWRGNIYRLAVRPDYRRQGVARALVAEVERILTRQGARRITALVEKDHAWATGFWEAVGYGHDRRMVRHVRTLQDLA